MGWSANCWPSQLNLFPTIQVRYTIHFQLRLVIPTSVAIPKKRAYVPLICCLFWCKDEQTPMAPKSPQKKMIFVEDISGNKFNMEIELEEATIADSDSDTSDASEGMNLNLFNTVLERL